MEGGDKGSSPPTMKQPYIAKLTNKVTGLKFDYQTLDVKSQQYDGQTTLEEAQMDGKLLNHIRDRLNEYYEEIYGESVSELALKKSVEELGVHRLFLDKIQSKIANMERHLTPTPVIQTPAAVPSTSTSGSQSRTSVKLPRVEPPKFEGKYEEWLSFKDLFKATIIDNQSLSGAMKLQYLKLSLKGEAGRQVNSFPVTDPNFQVAWDLTCKRYDNKREIVFALISKLVGAKPVISESATHLQRLVDIVQEAVLSLKVLGRQVDAWDDLLVYLVLDKVDPDTKKEWTRDLKNSEVPTFSQIMEFMESRIRSLLAFGIKSQAGDSSKRVHHTTTPDKDSCGACGENHPIYNCQKFKSLSSKERYDTVKKARVCMKCLSSRHFTKECTSTYKCKTCNDTHHTLLHFEKRDSKEKKKEKTYEPPPAKNRFIPGGNVPTPNSHNLPPPPPTFQNMEVAKTSSTFHTISLAPDSRSLLATALVLVKTKSNCFILCRIMLDSGAQGNIIREGFLQRLGIKRFKADPVIYGVGDTPIGQSKGIAPITFKSRYDEYEYMVNALVMNKVTTHQPEYFLPHSHWTHLKNLTLADPMYYEPGEVDMIIGAGIFFKMITGERVMGPPGTPTALATHLGWIIGGDIPSPPNHQYNAVRVHSVALETITDIVKGFWQLEEVAQAHQLTPVEKIAEEHFVATHTRNSDGRYETKLPFNHKILELGASREMAHKRLLSLERRLDKNPQWKPKYVSFMREYKDLGHMRLVPQEMSSEVKGMTNYLPHHFVLKENSTTTKLRVVFDGSAATSSGISLNETLAIGPKVQRDLFQILLNFRVHHVALKADIVKMYRQFNVSLSDTPFLRILWRESPELPIQTFELTTVTYGTSSAPHTATRCLKQLVEDEGSKFPVAAQLIEGNFYVDDLMSSFPSSEKAREAYEQLTSLVQLAGLKLTKWDSNSQEVLKGIPEDHRESNGHINVEENILSKVLGVVWNSRDDTFGFEGFSPKPSGKITKRIILSEMSRVFDPIGLISPFTVKVKLFFQRLWSPVITEDGERTLGWDDEIPQELFEPWEEYLEGFRSISLVKVPRVLIPEGSVKWELHGFSDASEVAYSAVIYIRCFSKDNIFTNLVTSKTRVAPVRQISLPKLELSGALLLSRLMVQVLESTHLKCPFYGWSDSEIVLHWLSKPSRRFQTFVANRVAEVQELIPSESWRYVPTESNPADCASRGMSVHDLVNFDLWWFGPPWLRSDPLPAFSFTFRNMDSTLLEEKRVHLVTLGDTGFCMQKPVSSKGFNVAKYSKLGFANRVMSFVLRFIFNSRNQIENRKKGHLTPLEMDVGFKRLIKLAQSDSFQEEIDQLFKGKELRRSSNLLSLNPFLDTNGILRVGGRIGKSEESEFTKHQMILPSYHHLTRLVVEYFHISHLHAGFQLLWTNLRRELWIPRARNLIRTVIRHCVICQRHRAEQTEQLMGSLPTGRVTPARPFLHVGVDFAGPFMTQMYKGRGKVQYKSYFCIYVCFSSKAVHLEAVTDLSSEAFLASFRRFTSRRGVPSDVYSDNGGNFVKGERELRELVDFAQAEEMTRHLVNHRIKWHFNPPAAPHMGGLWEAGVKSAKFHLKRVVGIQALTLEEFGTLLCQVEGALNSRPLCSISDSPEEMEILTPGHFLIGQPMTALPEVDVTMVKENRLNRWQRVTQMFQHFWKRWSAEYLTSLQQRYKWKNESHNVEVGQIVLIRDDDYPPLYWQLGRIVKVHSGKDGAIRVVTVKTSTNELQRPLVKLVPLRLPASNNSWEGA